MIDLIADAKKPDHVKLVMRPVHSTLSRGVSLPLAHQTGARQPRFDRRGLDDGRPSW
ncbi:hypothetical protein P7L64_24245 [Tistrella bauzanensis]|uniref:hypothetical protein n=1 Tax=Tistrella bauzanensis TaxID=657419 RepID=UPI0016696DA1|nr:hypothetical protein [Tistrella bauzanensis]